MGSGRKPSYCGQGAVHPHDHPSLAKHSQEPQRRGSRDRDVIKGSAGFDLIYADDGDTRDRILGGRCRDKCYVDTRSEAVRGCSNVIVQCKGALSTTAHAEARRVRFALPAPLGKCFRPVPRKEAGGLAVEDELLWSVGRLGKPGLSTAPAESVWDSRALLPPKAVLGGRSRSARHCIDHSKSLDRCTR